MLVAFRGNHPEALTSSACQQQEHKRATITLMQRFDGLEFKIALSGTLGRNCSTTDEPLQRSPTFFPRRSVS